MNKSKMCLVNSYNTTSAGTIEITSMFLKELCDNSSNNKYIVLLPKIEKFSNIFLKYNENIKLIYFHSFSGLLKIIFRIIFELFIIPFLVYYYKVNAVLVLGNYAPLPFRNKVVFMQYSFLVDDNIFNEYKIIDKFSNLVRKGLFWLTVKSKCKIIVQSDLIRNYTIRKYGTKNIDIYVFPNPRINASIVIDVDEIEGVKENLLLYISRYYAHKNHIFILKIAKKYANEFRNKNIKFYITLDPKINNGVYHFLKAISDNNLGDIIINIGEIPKESVKNHYKNSLALIFPSQAESFGIPILEAMSEGLPVIVPDLPYTRSICSYAGLYYKNNDVDDAYNVIIKIIIENNIKNIYRKLSLERSKEFPTIDQWIRNIINIL
jgi:glycosyltransferase involved in cell wall biosynthesis